MICKSQTQIMQDYLERKKKLKQVCAIETCAGICLKHHTYCNRHAAQLWIHGAVRERTMKDPNEFRLKGDTLFMDLHDINSELVATITLDVEDYVKVKDRRWTFNQFSQQIYSKAPTYISLKRTLLNIEPRRKVGFIDGNLQNFHKANLEVLPISRMRGRNGR